MKGNRLVEWQVYDQMPQGMISIAPTGKIEYMNRSARKTLSYQIDEWVDLHINEVFKLHLLAEQNLVPIAYDKILKERRLFQFPQNCGVTGSSGEVIPINGHIAPIFEENSVRNLLLTFDLNADSIDMSKQVEIERNNFKVLFDHAPQGMMTVSKDYKIVNMNAATAKIFNISERYAIGKKIGETFGCINYVNSDNECTRTNACPTCVFKNAVDNILLHGMKLNGIEFLFDFQNDFFGTNQNWLKLSAVPMTFDDEMLALIVMEDVTLNRELEKSLIRNEKRLRLITDNMIDTIAQVDQLGNVEFVTPSCWTLLGYNPDEVVGKNFMDYVYKEDIDLVSEIFKKRFITKDSFSTSLRLVRINGEVIWVEANASVVDDENRRRTVVYVIRDITTEVCYKDELKKSKEAAISASKSKSEFLANMSHEIRTPMNGIIGMTNITLMDDQITEDQRENITMVKNSAVSLLGIINSILDFSKIEAGKIELEKIEFDLKEMVSRTVNPLIISADQKGIEVNVSYDGNIHKKFVGDPGRISQILNNLIFNAIKFTETGGIYVHFNTVEVNPSRVELHCSVRDTGIGIPKEEQCKLFDSFHQVDGSLTRKYGGTGLGLAITKNLIDQMGGTISVDSNMGKGSVFKFFIQLKVAEIHNKSKTNQIQINLPKINKKLSILLVEDDLINRKMTRKILEKQGHEVVIAVNGKDAVNEFSKKNFDLILMDIQMPEMDGIKASKIIKAKAKEKNIYVPIIALTAYAIAGDEERFIGEGLDDYISKPIDLVKFFDVIMRNIKNEEVIPKEENDEIKEILERVRRKKKEDVSVNFEQIFQFFNKIDEGLRERNYEAVESAAHRLKNLLSEVGYIHERKLTFKLELAARKSNLDQILETYKALKVSFNVEGKE